MQEERSNKIRNIQIAEIELIRLFVDICEKEHLMYYMLGGTLLGAIRHKGYIPWDDDADLGMPRGDYEKFLTAASKYLPRGVRLSTYNGEDHYLYITRLLNEKKKVKINGVLVPHTNCVWIDIFPLDGMPENPVCRKIHMIRLMLARKLFNMANFEKIVPLDYPHEALLDRIGASICRKVPLYKLVSKQKAWRRVDKALKACPYERSSWSLILMGAYKFKDMYKKSIFGEGAFYDFEGMKLRGPVDHDAYLTQIYGDYMTPPPEAERNSRHNAELVED